LSFIKGLKNSDATVAASRDIAFYLAELTIALLWLEFLNKQNTIQQQYFAALNFWLRYKMKDDNLYSAEELMLI
jgi:hypothetical protein